MTDNKQNARKQAQRRARQRKQRNRRIALTACLMIAVMVASIGGTLAWLTDTTTPLTNTFTVGDINIDLYEHDPNHGNEVTKTGVTYQMIPGTSYSKDPVVVVEANSEKCYLFVEFTEENYASTYLDFTYNTNGWNKLNLTGADANRTVYYRIVNKSAADQSFQLLVGDETHPNGVVTVKNTIVKTAVENSGAPVMPTTTNEADLPKITFTAYAVQYDNVTTANGADDPNAAWAIAQNKGVVTTTP